MAEALLKLVQGGKSAAKPESSARSSAFRRALFMQQDGLLLGFFVLALDDLGILDRLGSGRAHTVGEIAATSGASRGYLHVILRALASAGWLVREGTPGTDALTYSLSPLGARLVPHLPLYSAAARFLRDHLPLERTVLDPSSHVSSTELEKLVDLAVTGWIVGPEADRVRMNLDGMLVVPCLLALWQVGRLDDPWKGHEHHHGTRQVLRLFAHLGWVDNTRRAWTREGSAVRKHVLHYGTVVSYMPMLRKLGSLLGGNATQATHDHSGQEEAHVDRRLNVLASAHAHKRYVQDAEAIFLEIFDKTPLDQQPSFVCDMGCGDGTWLRQIYALVKDRTARGKHLAERPLLMVGVDYNAAALRITETTLADANVPCLVLPGDITDPDRLAVDLAAHGLSIEDGVHIRSFIDHNRVFDAERAAAEPDAELHSKSTGAFVNERGELVPTDLLSRDLIAYLRRWAPHVRRHGLVVLEAHAVEPSITAAHIGESNNVVFDAYHGLSQQYPVDYNVFMEAAERAGLRPVLHTQRRYPARVPFVAISINRFVVAGSEACEDALPPIPSDRGSYVRELGPRSERESEHVASAEEVASADSAMLDLMYADGDTTRLRAWLAPATGELVRRTIDRLDQLLEQIRTEHRMPLITVLDIGDGTPAFAIELLRAMRRGGQMGHARSLGVRFELAIAARPSASFTMTQATLRHERCVRFYELGTTSFADVFWEQRIDIAVAPNLLRPIDARVLRSVLDQLGTVLCDDAPLFWSSPLVPEGREGIPLPQLLSALGRACLRAIDETGTLARLTTALPDEERDRYSDLGLARRQISASLDPMTRGRCRRRAERLLAPAPLAVIESRGDSELATRAFEIRPSELVDAVLALGLLPEIEDADVARRLLELVAPEVCATSGAATSDGCAVEWILGES